MNLVSLLWIFSRDVLSLISRGLHSIEPYVSCDPTIERYSLFLLKTEFLRKSPFDQTKLPVSFCRDVVVVIIQF